MEACHDVAQSLCQYGPRWSGPQNFAQFGNYRHWNGKRQFCQYSINTWINYPIILLLCDHIMPPPQGKFRCVVLMGKRRLAGFKKTPSGRVSVNTKKRLWDRITPRFYLPVATCRRLVFHGAPGPWQPVVPSLHHLECKSHCRCPYPNGQSHSRV